VWEKYFSEIGTEEGPRRHVDENPQNYSHLNGFVAFDIEHWWAERSISYMINETQASPVKITQDTKRDTHSELARSSCFNMKTFNSNASIHMTLLANNSSQLCIC
jgi:hypothetical protein